MIKLVRFRYDFVLINSSVKRKELKQSKEEIIVK